MQRYEEDIARAGDFHPQLTIPLVRLQSAVAASARFRRQSQARYRRQNRGRLTRNRARRERSLRTLETRITQIINEIFRMQERIMTRRLAAGQHQQIDNRGTE